MQRVSSQKDNWSEVATRPPEPQAPSPRVSRAALRCGFQPGVASLRALGWPCHEQGHCFSPANWGKVLGRRAGLHGSLGPGVVTAVSWAAPAGTDLSSSLRFITGRLSSVPPFLQVLLLLVLHGEKSCV